MPVEFTPSLSGMDLDIRRRGRRIHKGLPHVGI
jgi:hypothetical protein